MKKIQQTPLYIKIVYQTAERIDKTFTILMKFVQNLSLSSIQCIGINSLAHLDICKINDCVFLYCKILEKFSSLNECAFTKFLNNLMKIRIYIILVICRNRITRICSNKVKMCLFQRDITTNITMVFLLEIHSTKTYE